MLLLSYQNQIINFVEIPFSIIFTTSRSTVVYVALLKFVQ